MRGFWIFSSDVAVKLWFVWPWWVNYSFCFETPWIDPVFISGVSKQCSPDGTMFRRSQILSVFTSSLMSKATGKSPSSREAARLNDGNFSLQPKRPILKTNAFQSNRYVELFVECTDLEQLDTFSNSDPLCVLSVKKLGQWTEYERTESIPNNLHPKVNYLFTSSVKCVCANIF